MIIVSSHIPIGAPSSSTEVGAVCLFDPHQGKLEVRIVSSVRELAEIINEHSFLSRAAWDHFETKLLSTSFPDERRVPTETVHDPLAGLMNAMINSYDEAPQLRGPVPKTWGVYLGHTMPGALLFAYVDRDGVHHAAFFFSINAVEEFCIKTHLNALPHEHLACLLDGSPYLPRVGPPVRIFDGTLAEVLAEGTRILKTQYDAPTVD